MHFLTGKGDSKDDEYEYKLVMTGGVNRHGIKQDKTWLYTKPDGEDIWEEQPEMVTARYQHISHMTERGDIYVLGGSDERSCEKFNF